MGRKGLKGKAVSGIILILLFLGMLHSVLNIQSARANPGTIYIRADGSIDPSTANITTLDNITYTFTYNNHDSLVIQKDNIIVDGAGYTLQGSGAWDSKGIDLTGTSNVTIRGIEFKSFWYGIWLDYSSNCIIFGNKITDMWHGIWLVESPNNTISENNVTRWERGIYLSGSSNNTLSGNKIVNPNYGIWLDYSSDNNRVIGNSITDSLKGVYLYDSSGNTVSENSVINNVYGIELYGSSSNTVSENNITHWERGIYLSGSSNNILSRNKITDTTDYGICLGYSSSDNRIIGNNIANNTWDAIYLYDSSANTVSENNIENNDCGIELYGSSSNTVSENNITENRYGVWIYNYTDNRFFHNNFINNTNQVHVEPDNPNIWDDGYPSGGNFWSDYIDIDQYSGPYQNETGSDGIWDHPYVIDENNQDNYPFALPETTPPTIIITYPENKTYSTNILPLTFTVDESTSWIGYSLNGQANATTTENTTLPILPDGWHNVAVYANDTFNNMGMSIVYFTVDTANPNITNVLQNPPTDILPDTTVEINATITDATSGIKQVILNYTTGNGIWITIDMITLEGEIWNAAIPPYPYCTSITYVIIAVDNANNSVTSEETGYDTHYHVIPESSSFLLLSLFIIATLATVAYAKKRKKT